MAFQCLSTSTIRMNAEISETIRARLPVQRKFVLAGCHTRSNALKPPKTVVPTVLMLEKRTDPKKVCHAHFNAHDA